MKNPAGVLWFTGLSGAGKTTLAHEVDANLEARGVARAILDGDEVRDFFGNDLGYARPDREANIRRIAFAAHTLSRNGVLALVANIAPYREVRNWIRERTSPFALVYVHTPIEVCRERDFKGVYRSKTPVIGVDEPYDVPSDAEIVVEGDKERPESAAVRVISYLEENSWLSR